jgi:Ca2+/H+ antiporter
VRPRLGCLFDLLVQVFIRWFGLILLPIVSFSADGAITIGFFFRSVLRVVSGTPPPPVTIAKARAIDLSIQFTLFWMPFLVLLGWMTNKPMMLLFGRSLSGVEASKLIHAN